MKFVCTIGYLLLVALQSFLITKQQKFQIAWLKGMRPKRFVNSLLVLVVFLISFVQFWLLARVFPVPLIALLLGASILAMGINSMIGAVVGFTLEEKQEKIAALSIIWAIQRPVFNCLFMAVAILLMFTSAFGSLWEFWSHPIGDAHAKVWIAIFQFLLPQVFEIPYQVALTWPVVTSEFIDDDVRNASLASSFSKIISQTLFLFFPLWIVRNEIQGVLGWAAPHLWILLCVPLLVFMVGNLLPFFIGVHRYRSRLQFMIRWQEVWLTGLHEWVQLPIGSARDSATQEATEKLHAEIGRSLSQNSVLELYKSLATTEQTGGQEIALSLPSADAETANSAPAQTSISATSADSKDDELKKMLRDFTGFLQGTTQPQGPGADLQGERDSLPQAQIQSILLRYRSHLIDWDIRFGYLWKLVQYYEVSLEAKTKDVDKFIEARLKDIKTPSDSLTPKSNVLAGGIISVLSAIIVFLFKTYYVKIFELVGYLAKAKRFWPS
jgi:hypothetical protein